jgi:peptide/nickel transport system permease protein
MGADDFGRDLLSRVLYGGRPILTIGVSSIALALAAGIVVGLVTGYYGGWLDHVLMALMDLTLSFPFVLLAILIVSALGPGPINAIIAIAVPTIPTFARLSRSVVISLRTMPYVEASAALGAGHGRILRRHILPNLLGPLIVMATANLAMAIGYASALNFLGLGVQPPTPDWGLMVSGGEQFIYSSLQISFFPGLAITLTVVSLNFMGDGLQAFLDPTGWGRSA